MTTMTKTATTMTTITNLDNVDLYIQGHPERVLKVNSFAKA